MDDGAHIRHTGVSNKIILDNLRKLSKNGALISIRFPVIPGVNDSDANLKQMVEFLNPMENVKRIQLLPYHKTAAHKYQRLGHPMDWKTAVVPSQEKMAHIQEFFETCGFSVSQGDYEI
jgi:pyruvate formate lyase activating enzyme